MATRIEDRKEERGERRLRLFRAEFAIDLCRDASGIAKAAGETLNKIQKVRQPDTGGEPLAGNVADSNAKKAVEFEFDYLEEVAREMTDREDFAGNFVTAPIEFAGSAQPALNLRGFKDRLLKQVVFAALAIELYADGMDRRQDRRRFFAGS